MRTLTKALRGPFAPLYWHAQGQAERWAERLKKAEERDASFAPKLLDAFGAQLK